MAIKKCENCRHQFKWSQIFGSIFAFHALIKCNACGQEYKVSSSSRLIHELIVIAAILMLSLFLSSNPQISFWGTGFGILIAIIILISSFFPFYAKYQPVE
ncbi:TIGR04104 family putative zinc finger protein [Domibacillus mangrovi]|uniref:Cxxc_20_cxxc protein n=1 Tax=Domibacillus mangrovi TaxID=1714354 RepID=A0A1Q5P3R8_9BACI|nr:hypothetical protein BLL40_09160 [Domibacillus mangrovi]